MQIEQLDYWFPLLTNNSPFLFAILDDQHRYHCVNNRYSDISGKPQHQLIGSNDIDTLGSHYYQCLKPYYERAFKGEVIEAEIIINDTSHHTNLHISLAPLLNRLGKIEHIILHSVDTSERHVLINSLQESEHQLNQLQNLVTDGICVIEKNIIINANQRAIELLGMTSKNALLGQTLDHVLLDNNKQPCHSKTLTQASNNGNQHYYSANHNASSPLMLTTSPITMMGEAALLIKLTPALNNDVQQHKIEQLTQLDPLTGLYNRHGFSRQLDQLMQANTPLFMLYIDIDNFKNINDSLGHHIGDKVLQEIAQRLQQLLPKNAIIGHLSGDEFAVLLTHPEHENSGKMSKAVRMRLWLEIELQKALQNNGLEVWYQPKVNAKNFEIDGAEALVRWKHPVEGYISPAQFIPVAERSGLIEQLGRVVMREVFTTVNQWKKQQLLKGRVAINLSSLQFENPKLIHFVDKLRQSTGINAADFTFELTESTVMNDGEHTIQMLNAIKQQGFALSIDDFGTGYSSLSYLARFPLDELKIDRAFIKDIDTIPKQITLIENIINLGKSLNMSVVAEIV
jgi:diguanylate cyclase (GGDEF)-like protein